MNEVELRRLSVRLMLKTKVHNAAECAALCRSRWLVAIEHHCPHYASKDLKFMTMNLIAHDRALYQLEMLRKLK